jgi:predicted RNase H-like nuclease (RuvC/YqgF family)
MGIKKHLMTLDKEFFDNLGKLEKYKSKPDLWAFFDSIDKIEKLCIEINEKIQEKPSEISKLDKQAKELTKILEEKKDEIAMFTKTQDEFDAVYECIDYLDSQFN